MERNNENSIEKKTSTQKNYKVLRKMFEESRKKVQCEMSKNSNSKSVPINCITEDTKDSSFLDNDPSMDDITIGNEMRANYNKYILSGGDNCLYPESENYQMSYQSYPKKRHIPMPLRRIAFFFIILLKAITTEKLGLWGFMLLFTGIICYFEKKSFGILLMVTSLIPLYLTYKAVKEDYMRNNYYE